MAKKKKPAKKKPTKRSPAKKKPTKRSPAKKKPTRRKPTKRAPAEKPKKKGLIGSAIGKIPEKVHIKGGKSKYKSKHGTMETSYEDIEVGK